MNIQALREKLLASRPNASEHEINKAIVDYAELISFPDLIRSPQDFDNVLSYLDCVIAGEV